MNNTQIMSRQSLFEEIEKKRIKALKYTKSKRTKRPHLFSYHFLESLSEFLSVFEQLPEDVSFTVVRDYRFFTIYKEQATSILFDSRCISIIICNDTYVVYSIASYLL